VWMKSNQREKGWNRLPQRKGEIESDKTSQKEPTISVTLKLAVGKRYGKRKEGT